MRRTEYLTQEARESAIRCIEGCIKAINESSFAEDKGYLTAEYTTKYLAEYKKLIARDMEVAK